jgi:hypothetical protein
MEEVLAGFVFNLFRAEAGMRSHGNLAMQSQFSFAAVNGELLELWGKGG